MPGYHLFFNTNLSDIVPQSQRFSQMLDDLTKLAKQHRVLIVDLGLTKRVYMFGDSYQLLISDNRIVENGT